jgi:hypothetical protein
MRENLSFLQPSSNAAYTQDVEIERRRGRFRSFLLGSVLGASAAALAAARRKPSPPKRVAPSGLAAFEGAPCYRETVEREERS